MTKHENQASIGNIVASIMGCILALAILLLTGLYGCNNKVTEEITLPILGEREVVEHEENGQFMADTIYHQVPDFDFINQDSQLVNSATFAGKIYVTDFFFTTCPTICPKMKSQMLRVYENFKDNPQVMLLSHTIDPEHDTVAVLHDFAERLNVSSSKWHFVTGQKDSIYSIAQKYFVSAQEDKAEAGGFVHSGAFVLVDENRRIRGIYDGTDPGQVDRLLKDIPVLLKEQKHENK